jgi:hypothetical protein
MPASDCVCLQAEMDMSDASVGPCTIVLDLTLYRRDSATIALYRTCSTF